MIKSNVKKKNNNSIEEDILNNKRSILSNSDNVKYNEEDIDFNTLISNEKDSNIRLLHEYFSNQTPTEQNSYTGIFKGKNVIFLQLEGIDNWLITEKDTPTLYKMMNNSINFLSYFSEKL